MPREFLQVLRLVPQYLFDHGVAFVVSRVLADTPGLDAGDCGGQGRAGGRGAGRQRPVHDGRWRRWKGDETATILDGGKSGKIIRILYPIDAKNQSGLGPDMRLEETSTISDWLYVSFKSYYLLWNRKKQE